MSEEKEHAAGLDPAMRDRLIKESLTPWRGLRRTIWFAFLASAIIGLLTMGFNPSRTVVSFSNIGIKAAAFFLFAWLIWFDRDRSN